MTLLSRYTPKLTPLREYPGEEQAADSVYGKIWEDFDHSYAVGLGVTNQTAIVCEKRSKRPHILQSCDKADVTPQRWRMLEASRTNPRLVPNHFVFSSRGRTWVGSRIADVSLADVIDCTIALDDRQIGVILTHVVQALRSLARIGIQYNRVKASSVYMTSAGCNRSMVQLASFGPRIEPKELASEDLFNPDCAEVGHLAYHMKTRVSKLPEQKQARWGLENASKEFAGFLKLCMAPSASLAALSRHKFLTSAMAESSEDPTACLLGISVVAQRSAYRLCTVYKTRSANSH